MPRLELTDAGKKAARTTSDPTAQQGSDTDPTSLPQSSDGSNANPVAKPKLDAVGFMKDQFPSDEELQGAKSDRKSIIDNLRAKGLPAPAADAAEWVSNAATPDTREEYMNSMMPAIGSVENRGAQAVGKSLGTAAEENTVSKLRGKFPSAKNLGEVSSEVRGDAIRDPSKLALAASDPEGAMAARAVEKKGLRKSAQELKDIAEGTKKAGGDISASPDLDYSEINKIVTQEPSGTIDYKSFAKPKQSGYQLTYKGRMADPTLSKVGK